MKNLARALCLFVVLLQAKSAYAEDYLIINAHLFKGGTAAPAVSLLIRDGRITSVGPSLAVPENVTIIDAAGGIVTPGLMNSATELGLIELYAAKETVDSSGSSHNLGPGFDVAYSLNANSVLLDIARTEGLARAAVLPGGADKSHFSGLGAVLHLRRGQDIVSDSGAMLVMEAGGVGASDAARGAAWIAVRTALLNAQATEEDADEATEILQKLLSGALPLVIRASRESDLRQAMKLADDFGLRVIIVGGEEAWRVAPMLAVRHIPVVLNPFDNLPLTFDSIGTRGDNAVLLHGAGVEIGFFVASIYKSHNAGTMLRIGAGVAASRGLDRQVALDAITKGPALIWGIDEDYGVLEAGKVADIVIWSGDPLEPRTSAKTIFIDGALFDMRSRQTELRDRYHPHRDNRAYPPAYQN